MCIRDRLNAVVLEEVAKMAIRTENLNKDITSIPSELQDKHYFRKHGANAYYGQSKVCLLYTSRCV